MPVLTIERVEDAVPLARALVAGGVRTLEVTLRTPVAIEAAKAIIAEVPDAIVGIGTILNADDLARAEALGAKFGISPGATPELLKAAAAERAAVRAGHRHRVRADAGAGAWLRSREILPGRAGRRYQGTSRAGGPFPHAQFCPTGGIGEANARGVARRAERGRGRRFLAVSAGGYQVRQLGRHNCHLRADHEIAESGVNSTCR